MFLKTELYLIGDSEEEWFELTNDKGTFMKVSKTIEFNVSYFWLCDATNPNLMCLRIYSNFAVFTFLIPKIDEYFVFDLWESLISFLTLSLKKIYQLVNHNDFEYRKPYKFYYVMSVITRFYCIVFFYALTSFLMMLKMHRFASKNT